MFNRQTPLGVPNESGRFPVIAGVKMPKNYIPPEYIEALNNDDSITDKQAVLNSVLPSLIHMTLTIHTQKTLLWAVTNGSSNSLLIWQESMMHLLY